MEGVDASSSLTGGMAKSCPPLSSRVLYRLISPCHTRSRGKCHVTFGNTWSIQSRDQKRHNTTSGPSVHVLAFTLATSICDNLHKQACNGTQNTTNTSQEVTKIAWLSAALSNFTKARKTQSWQLYDPKQPQAKVGDGLSQHTGIFCRRIVVVWLKTNICNIPLFKWTDRTFKRSICLQRQSSEHCHSTPLEIPGISKRPFRKQWNIFFGYFLVTSVQLHNQDSITCGSISSMTYLKRQLACNEVSTCTKRVSFPRAARRAIQQPRYYIQSTFWKTHLLNAGVSTGTAVLRTNSLHFPRQNENPDWNMFKFLYANTGGVFDSGEHEKYESIGWGEKNLELKFKKTKQHSQCTLGLQNSSSNNTERDKIENWKKTFSSRTP